MGFFAHGLWSCTCSSSPAWLNYMQMGEIKSEIINTPSREVSFTLGLAISSLSYCESHGCSCHQDDQLQSRLSLVWNHSSVSIVSTLKTKSLRFGFASVFTPSGLSRHHIPLVPWSCCTAEYLATLNVQIRSVSLSPDQRREPSFLNPASATNCFHQTKSHWTR